ncbi:hypothetical protein [Stenotrophomonas indicatrix]|uniref:hypothetical protein n=1 Tax=Stenotrophomonas indicatrix TaxID=2045451 RepID=UPI00115F877B|nr:hypothetical protein [Stenotrophomonas indicatrix]
MPDKQNALLLDIADSSEFPGDVVHVSSSAACVVDATTATELRYHISCLRERGLLIDSDGPSVVSARGWEYLELLHNPVHGNRSDFFVAMSFRDELAEAWRQGIEPGAREAGYVAKRVDSDPHNGKIDDRIIAGIRSSFGVIADATTQNVGAYFEAGFAMGLGRPLVWTVRVDDIKNLHFDTRQFVHIVWSDPADLKNKLATHLLAIFGKGPILQ